MISNCLPVVSAYLKHMNVLHCLHRASITEVRQDSHLFSCTAEISNKHSDNYISLIAVLCDERWLQRTVRIIYGDGLAPL